MQLHRRPLRIRDIERSREAHLFSLELHRFRFLRLNTPDSRKIQIPLLGKQESCSLRTVVRP